MVAGRYRIVGLLGRGGMGEVYRADDLKLGQPVALKFLPEEMQKSEDRLRRFLDEVRLALRITHPNVCRVYDIGEVDSQHYISMEYVDGEDLASLLRRIGRLPQDRGVTVARQICAGLAAAHTQGILHRDLKPANIMIDGRGRARITDFGLAGFAGGAESREDRSGTPAYMAPEQLAGSAASERSDIYALGLILYEIFAGVPAFEAAASVDAIRQQRSSTPTSMSSHVPGLDAAIETAIMRALEPDPARRPASVLGLAAALPGGDPLAAALAAGETPSPEMVAGAATEVGLRKPVAIACLAVGLLSLLLVAFGIPRQDLLALVSWKLTPTELSVRAQQVLRELGGPERPRVIRDGVIADEGYISWIRENDHSMTRWDRLADARPAAVRYWLRASPTSLEPADAHAFSITLDDPPQDPPGGFTIQLDAEGRLVGFRARWSEPTPGDDASGTDVSIDRLFALAGLDRSLFRSVDPVVPPAAPGDALQAWSDSVDVAAGGATADSPHSATSPSSPLEGIVQVGTLGGRLSSFDVVYPWHRADDSAGESGGRGFIALAILLSIVILIGIVLARRNIRRGSGDRRGAFRLVLFFIVTVTGSWVIVDLRLRDLHLGELFWQLVFGRVLAHALLHAVLAWLMYLALEPYVRRLWPETLISWTRLLIGGFRDPQVGRDLLIGSMAGSLLIALETSLLPWLRTALGVAAAEPNLVHSLEEGGPVPGVQAALGGFLGGAQASVYIPMVMLLMLLLLRVVTRRNWAAAVVYVALFGTLLGLSTPDQGMARAIVVVTLVVFLAAFVFCLFRFGLLSAMAFFFFCRVTDFPLTLDPSSWYADASFTALALFGGVIAWAFSAAIGGSRVFGGSGAAPRTSTPY
jgi:serine/threonine-protein kinase